jgi:putative component of membrane protein insertase Oxa1/YidC/SpoIIIJ protein YidD
MLASCMLYDALSQLLTCLSQLSEVLNNHGKEICANQVATDILKCHPLWNAGYSENMLQVKPLKQTQFQ